MLNNTSSKRAIRILFFVVAFGFLYQITTSLISSQRHDDVSDGSNNSKTGSQFGLGAATWKGKIESLKDSMFKTSGNQSTDPSEEAEEESQKPAEPEEIENEADEEELLEEYHHKNQDNQNKTEAAEKPSHAYKVHPKPVIKEPPASKETSMITETTIPGLQHHTRINNAEKAKYLVLVVTIDENSWGKLGDKPRTVEDFCDFVKETSGLPVDEISMAISTTTEVAYKAFVDAMSKRPFAKSQVILSQPTDEMESPPDRHEQGYQPYRRQQIAFARNILMLRALRDEQHIFWYDADVIGSSDGIAAKMAEHSENNGRFLTTNTALHRDRKLSVGLITTRCNEDANQDYDLNAWADRNDAPGAGRKVPSPEELDELRKGTLWMGSGPTEALQSMKVLTAATLEDEVFSLDSVGGVLLYMRADLVRKGLVFPSYYVIGPGWDTPNGWDGIETEGLCYIAKTMGYGCYGLGGSWHVSHWLHS